MARRICFVAAVATAGADGRLLGAMPGDGLGPGVSPITATLRAAQDRASGRIWEGVARVQDLESQNADLWRRNKELEKRAAAADEEVTQIKDSSAAKRRARVLAQEVADLKSKEAALEADKSALVATVEKLMRTNDTEALNRRLEQASKSKLAEERQFAQQQQDTQAQLKSMQQKAKDASAAAESLQQENLEMRKAGQTVQGEVDDLHSQISATRAQKERLEESVESTTKTDKAAAATAAKAQKGDLQADASDLRKKVQDAGLNVQRLQDELRDAKQQVDGKGEAASKADAGGAEILQTLQEQNLDLQRSTDAARSEAKDLKAQIGSLQYDKEHLIAAMQSSMRDADSLKQLLKTKIAEKDSEITEKDRKLVDGARQLAAIESKAAAKALHHAAAPQPAKTAAAPQTVASQPSATSEPQPRSDPILTMQHRAENERRERAQMQEFARDAVAATGDESLAFAPGADPVAVESAAEFAAAEPAAEAAAASRPPVQVGRWLAGARTAVSGAQPLSPVDSLDPEAVAKEQRAAKVDTDAVQGDAVEQLLKQAQLAVDGPVAA